MKFMILKMVAVAFCMLVTGCKNSENEITPKTLIIASKETTKLKELSLSITNNGCGREWGPGGERPYCDLIIKYKDSTIRAGDDFKAVYIGNIEIKIDKMNPWGRMEDSVPPGGCRVIVTHLTDIQH